MKNVPQITDSEWEIMKIVWDNPPHTSGDIISKLSDTTNWKPTTIKTLISRLVNKAIVGIEKDSRRYLYYPLISENDCRHAENKSFLKKIYGGSVKPLILNFLESEDLSQADIEELQSRLNKMSK